MPLFRTKFQPKKAPARKATTTSNLRRNLDAVQLEKEFGLQVDTVRLDLGDHHQFEFSQEDGKWNSLNPSKSNRCNSTSKLEGENNLLKIKVEVLLDMVRFKLLKS